MDSFKSRLLGVSYCFLWFTSIVAGFFILICPTIILAFFSPRLYRAWTDLVFGMWEPYSVALMEVFFNVRIVMSGDWIDSSEGSIIVMNHRTRLDWNFLWAAFYHGAHPHSHNLKYILKAPIMHIPGPGWVMQACSFLFIHRSWEKDQRLMARSLEYLQATEKHTQILIFPEGTDLTPKTLEKSHSFADKNGLSHYGMVLHPRTTGFTHLAKNMIQNGQLQAVYDITVGYPKNIAKTEVDLMKGNFPKEIHFLVNRYDVTEIPEKESELAIWLNSRWRKKEMVLKNFYEHGSFNSQDCVNDWSKEKNIRQLLQKRRPLQDGSVTCQCQNYYAHEVYTFHADSNGLQNGNGTAGNGRGYQPDEGSRDKACDDRTCRKMRYYSTGNLLYLSLIFWTTLVGLFFYLVIFQTYFQMWVTFFSILFFLLSIATDGFNQVLARYNTQDCLLKKKLE